jgi:hypothetical protein
MSSPDEGVILPARMTADAGQKHLMSKHLFVHQQIAQRPRHAPRNPDYRQSRCKETLLGIATRRTSISGRYGSLVVFDEILAGFYRTGEPFVFSGFGVAPDIVLL